MKLLDWTSWAGGQLHRSFNHACAVGLLESMLFTRDSRMLRAS